jgi:hypothetical protein
MYVYMASTSNIEWCDLPIELRKELQAVNLHSVDNLQQKLAHRRTAQILSYLHLTVLRLCNEQRMNSRYVQKVQDADNMHTYLQQLQNRDQFLHNTNR